MYGFLNSARYKVAHLDHYWLVEMVYSIDMMTLYCAGAEVPMNIGFVFEGLPIYQQIIADLFTARF